jgi:hypothetical protein
MEAKETWDNKNAEVTLIPTYDNDTLRHWMGGSGFAGLARLDPVAVAGLLPAGGGLVLDSTALAGLVLEVFSLLDGPLTGVSNLAFALLFAGGSFFVPFLAASAGFGGSFFAEDERCNFTNF